MPVAYSEDLRGRVIAACVAKEGSQRQLAQRFKVSLSFVRNLLRHYRANGQIEAKRRGGYLKPIIHCGASNNREILGRGEKRSTTLRIMRSLCRTYRD